MDMKNIKMDVKKQDDGVWVDVDGETQFLIARMYNKNFNKLFEKLTSPYKSPAKRHLLDGDLGEKIMTETIAKTVILGWKNLKDGDKPVLYSAEKAIEIIADPSYASFREKVIDIATDENNYRAEEIKDTAKK